MLRPDIQWKNPVMFVVEVGTVLTLIYTIAKLLGLPECGERRLSVGAGFLARGDAAVRQLRLGHRRSPRQGPGRRLAEDAAGHSGPSPPHGWNHRSRPFPRNSAPATRVEVVAGEVIPSDGEIIEGVASIDESAITGESAPVIREAGGDRSGVTGGTRVLSDRIVVRSRPAPAVPSSTA